MMSNKMRQKKLRERRVKDGLLVKRIIVHRDAWEALRDLINKSGLLPEKHTK